MTGPTTMAEQGPSANFDLYERLKDKTPPVVPYAIILCVQELLERFGSKEVQTNVHALRSFFRNSANSLKSVSTRKIMEKLFRCLCTQQRTMVRQEIQKQRIDSMSAFHCHIIYATMRDFFSRCRDGISVKLRFPTDGWIIFGPPRTGIHSANDGWDKPELTMTKYARGFVANVTNDDPVRRDFFVYMMHFLSRLCEMDVVDPRRLKHIYALKQRRCIAEEFGKTLLQVHCEFCGKQLTETCKPCDKCVKVSTHLRRPAYNCALEHLLQYVTSDTWIKLHERPREKFSALMGRDQKIDDNYRNLEDAFFGRKKKSTRVKS